MIAGIGTDMVEIARVQKAIGRSAFLEKIYTEKERQLISERSGRAASNFAAKEAVAKALGCGFAGIAPVEIEVLRKPSGMPYVVLHGRAKEKASEQGIDKIQISLTDTERYAQAYAICERTDTFRTYEPGHNGARLEPKRRNGERAEVWEAACPVLDAVGMKTADRITVEEIGLPALVLMERAALAVADCVKEYATRQSRIGVLCGTGNNGGDGVATARILREAGYEAVVLSADAEIYRQNETITAGRIGAKAERTLHGTPEFLQQLQIAVACGVPVCEPEETKKYDIIVDALFGIGLSKPVEGRYARLLEQVNAEEHTVIAVDIASGIDASTGVVCGAALKAEETVTFGAAKCGHLLYPGKEYTGKLRVVDIGFPRNVLWEQRQGFYLEPEGAERLLPQRPAYSNKGTFGKVAVVAGSRNIAGAAYFAACAAYRTGAGLVKIVTPECNREVLQTLLPEAMLTTYTETEPFPELVEETLRFADAIVLGPGLGQSTAAERLTECFREALVKRKEDAPVSVWDADALNLIAKRMQEEGCSSKEERSASLEGLLPDKAVLTPHPGELSRLLGVAVTELTGSFLETAKELAGQSRLTFVLKDAVTLVGNGNECFFNTTGNNGLATGGSGDILSGMLAAMAAGGMDCFTAAVMGVYLHGASGDLAEQKTGAAPMVARDVLEAIEGLFAEKGKEVVK